MPVSHTSGWYNASLLSCQFCHVMAFTTFWLDITLTAFRILLMFAGLSGHHRYACTRKAVLRQVCMSQVVMGRHLDLGATVGMSHDQEQSSDATACLRARSEVVYSSAVALWCQTSITVSVLISCFILYPADLTIHIFLGDLLLPPKCFFMTCR